MSRQSLLAAIVFGASLLPACQPHTPAKSESFKAASEQPTPRLSLTWRKQVDIRETWNYLPQHYSQPVLLESRDDLVVATGDGYVTRLRAGSGEVVWRVELRDAAGDARMPLHATLLVVGDIVYVASITGVIQALALSDGESLWEYKAEDAVESKMAIGDGRLFFMDAKEILYSVDAETGKLLWRYQRRAPDYFTIKGAGIPVLDGDAVYCGFADGTLVAVQVDTGDVIWTSDLSADAVEFTDVDSEVIVGSETLYSASYSGGLFGVSRLDGTIQWRYPVEAVSDFILEQGVFWVASAQGRVEAIDAKTHKKIWGFRFKHDTPVKLAKFGGYLFVSTSAGPLAMLDAHSGKPLGKWNPSQGFQTAPIFSGTRGFIVSNGGFLYAFQMTAECGGTCGAVDGQGVESAVSPSPR